MHTNGPHVLYNLSDQDFTGQSSPLCYYSQVPISPSVNEGDRIAQLILERIVTPDVVEVEVSILETPEATRLSDWLRVVRT